MSENDLCFFQPSVLEQQVPILFTVDIGRFVIAAKLSLIQIPPQPVSCFLFFYATSFFAVKGIYCYCLAQRESEKQRGYYLNEEKCLQTALADINSDPNSRIVRQGKMMKSMNSSGGTLSNCLSSSSSLSFFRYFFLSPAYVDRLVHSVSSAPVCFRFIDRLRLFPEFLFFFFSPRGGKRKRVAKKKEVGDFP